MFSAQNLRRGKGILLSLIVIGLACAITGTSMAHPGYGTGKALAASNGGGHLSLSGGEQDQQNPGSVVGTWTMSNMVPGVTEGEGSLGITNESGDSPYVTAYVKNVCIERGHEESDTMPDSAEGMDRYVQILQLAYDNNPLTLADVNGNGWIDIDDFEQQPLTVPLSPRQEARLTMRLRFNENATNDYQGDECDMTMYVVSEGLLVNVSNITRNSATVRWSTMTTSSSSIDYGTTTSYGSTTGDGALVTSHAVELSNLAAGTTYHIRARSVDASDKKLESSDCTFTTTAQAMWAAWIRIKVPREWANLHGVDNVRIFRYTEDGTGEILETIFVGYEGDHAVFEAYSREGLSITIGVDIVRVFRETGDGTGRILETNFAGYEGDYAVFKGVYGEGLPFSLEQAESNGLEPAAESEPYNWIPIIVAICLGTVVVWVVVLLALSRSRKRNKTSAP
jgi:hypothetical protein